MNRVIRQLGRFAFFVLIQVLILNQVELGFGTQIMIYPLFVLLLPVNLNVFLLLFLSFALGLSIDAMSNTYGLHASALLVVAFFRPIIFKLTAPRDGYEQIYATNIYTMGGAWTVKTLGLLLLIHHFWFFLLELFKLDEILYLIQKTLLSLPLSFGICILLQYLFIKKPKEG
ncbi:MAG: hypothetical protein ACI865_002293 [Flavobacteriaceae bacterium]|jgi:hypothetical protein